MIPESLQEKIDHILNQITSSTLRKARVELSHSYKEKNSSAPIFSNDARTLAYLGVRFPATFSAICEVLKHAPPFETFLDLGAGPATGTLAASPKKAILIEKSKEAISLGKKLLDQEHQWIYNDLIKMESFPRVDLALASYSVGEISPLKPLLEKLWDSGTDTFAFIEPGTPDGYKTILEVRDFFISKGGNILAPCPHVNQCPLNGGNWCHFATRLPRTKLHRYLKGGERGFEDEKYSYLIISRQKKKEKKARILRHPYKGSGFVKFNLCTPEGENIEKTVSKKDKDLYKAAKEAKWGSDWC